MADLRLSPQVFAILATFIEERLGMHFDPDDAPVLADKLAPRAAELGLDSLLDYYYFLKYDAAGAREVDALVEALVVGETYFFREAAQLEVLCDEILEPLVHRDGPAPRVWCAASASGEEPLTLAMMLDARGLLGGVELVATDLSLRALERARAGDYGKRSLRSLPPGVIGRWIDFDGDRARVTPRLREAVRWERLNLVDRAAIARLGAFDAILCRNVLIYFRDETIRRVAESLRAALRPGGHLLIGASESLLRFGTPLECYERGGAFFYRRRVDDGAAPG
jgi:chemotaxis protein methyltransferase CheR